MRTAGICRMLPALGLALLTATLLGCPQPKPQVGEPPAVARSAASDEIITPGRLTDDWPDDDFPPYPGAKILEGRSWTALEARNMTAVLETPDSGQQVTNFYADVAAAAGFTVVTTSQTSDKWLGLFEKGTMSFSATAVELDPTRIELALIGLPLDDGLSDEAAEAAQQLKDQADASSDATEGADNDEPPAESDAPSTNARPENPLLPIYPGARREDRGEGPSLRMSTADSMDQVHAFYNSYYLGRGMTEEQSVDYGGQRSAIFSGPDGKVTLITRQAESAPGSPPRTEISLTMEPPEVSVF